jgi:protein-disulfide isomerase
MATLKVPVTSNDHFQGNPKAEKILVEYGDYECPYCGRAYPVVKRVQKHFGQRLAFVFRNFPLTEMHPNAEDAAETAEFAATQGKFWEMHDAIYENQDALSVQFLLELAEKLKLDSAALEEALNNGKFTKRIKEDFHGGVLSGVNGTPTFFINGQRHDGSFEYESLVEAIEAQSG